MNQSSSKLLKTTFIYFIGTVTVKLLNIVFLPLILVYLTTTEYGYYDLIITTISLILPVFSLQTIDAVFRFLFDSNEIQRKKVLTNVWAIIMVGCFLFLITLFLFNTFISKIESPMYIALYYIVTVVLNMYQRVARSLEKNKQFTISGILHSGVMILLMLIFVVRFRMKIDGMLLAYIISGSVAIIYLEIYTKASKFIEISLLEFEKIREILKFSVPLIPNTISWWAVASINKYIILVFLGAESNGIFAVSLKFASIITIVTSVFTLAWQESAILEFNNKDKEEYYSKTFDNYVVLLTLFSIIGLLTLKVFYDVLVPEEYFESWIYIPIVILATLISAVTSFYGAGYLAAKKTSGAFYSTIIAALVNILICIILINHIGLIAAPIANLISYFILWIFRHFTMKAFFSIKLNSKNIYMLIVLYIVITAAYYYLTPILNAVICFIIVFYTFTKYLPIINSLFKNKIYSNVDGGLK